MRGAAVVMKAGMLRGGVNGCAEVQDGVQGGWRKGERETKFS